MAPIRSAQRSFPLALLMLAGLPLGWGGRAAEKLLHAASPKAEVVLAGGCYWGVESVFRHVKGISSATSGLATPAAAGADPAPFAEAVRLVYDPAKISYAKILDVFFSVAHDPTQRDRQGPDVGTRYRSIVFVQNDSQRAVVRAYIDSLTAAHAYRRPIVTEIAALHSFDVMPPDQQDYAEKHPDDPYIVTNDRPKIEALHQRFPQLYRP